LDDLSKQYGNKEDQPRTQNGKFTVKPNKGSTDTEKENVLTKTAKKVNVSAKTLVFDDRNAGSNLD